MWRVFSQIGPPGLTYPPAGFHRSHFEDRKWRLGDSEASYSKYDQWPWEEVWGLSCFMQENAGNKASPHY